MPKSMILRGWEGVRACDYVAMFERQMFKLLVKQFAANKPEEARYAAKQYLVGLLQDAITRVMEYAD